MLDFNLAAIYGVETRALNQAVKRNIERFPEYFMFQLTKGEFEILKSQIVISNLTENQTNDILISQNVKSSCGGTRKLPYAISTALAELQSKDAPQKPRKQIGFIQE